MRAHGLTRIGLLIAHDTSQLGAIGEEL